jgi:regulator of RNase E activity RraA
VIVLDSRATSLRDCLMIFLPVYAGGVTPIGRLHLGPGELHFPIRCGGIVVNAGDIVADTVGIVARQDFAKELLRLYAHRDALEAYVAM